MAGTPCAAMVSGTGRTLAAGSAAHSAGTPNGIVSNTTRASFPFMSTSKVDISIETATLRERPCHGEFLQLQPLPCLLLLLPADTGAGRRRPPAGSAPGTLSRSGRAEVYQERRRAWRGHPPPPAGRDLRQRLPLPRSREPPLHRLRSAAWDLSRGSRHLPLRLLRFSQLRAPGAGRSRVHSQYVQSAGEVGFTLLGSGR